MLPLKGGFWNVDLLSSFDKIASSNLECQAQKDLSLSANKLILGIYYIYLYFFFLSFTACGTNDSYLIDRNEKIIDFKPTNSFLNSYILTR